MREELIVGGTGSTAIANTFPRVLNAVLGTKFRVIPGYPGANEALGHGARRDPGVLLARLRHPGCDPARLGARPQGQYFRPARPEEEREHPEVPLALDFAKSEADRQAIALIVSPNLFARPFAAPPGVPADRLEALRKGFDETMADPDFVAEAKARALHIELVTGAELDDVLRRLYATPKEIVTRVKEAVN